MSLPEADNLGDDEIDSIKSRDSFYLSTVNENGWPYIQHRGGAPGFLKVLNPTKIGFADYRGNRQLLSTGNLSHDDRVALFLMDYANRNRLKILGHARVLKGEDDPALALSLTDPETDKRVERFFVIDIDSYDWNCSQYITPRFTAEQIEAHLAPFKSRIAELENELQALRAKN